MVTSQPPSSYGAGESGRTGLVEMRRHPIEDRPMMGAGATDRQTVEYGGSRREKSLPPDASSTLFADGLPADCTRREVSRILAAVS